MFFPRANHPDCTTYCQDINLLLRHAIETHLDKNPQLLYSLGQSEPEILPPMPAPGDVDLIVAGEQITSSANYMF